MARRSDHSREQLYRLALDAAERIIAQDGLRGLSARGVAREIGYTVGTIYNVFQNFDDLIDHLNGRTMDRLHAACSPPSQGGTPAERLRGLAQRYIEFAAAQPKLYVTLFEHQHPQGSRPPDWYYEKVAGLLAIVEAAIAPTLPGAAPAEVEAQARVLWAGVHGIISLEGAGKVAGSSQAGDLVGLMIDNFLTAAEKMGILPVLKLR